MVWERDDKTCSASTQTHLDLSRGLMLVIMRGTGGGAGKGHIAEAPSALQNRAETVGNPLLVLNKLAADSRWPFRKINLVSCSGWLNEELES